MIKTGKLIKGSVEDCNKKWLERRLQNYDKQLYIKWNPNKNHGLGIWEIRRRPEYKTKVWQGGHYFKLEYVENDLVHHVMDTYCLTERILDKIYEMDTTRVHNWVDKLEYEQDRSQTRIENKSRDELRYNLKQNRKILEDFREAVRSGYNPFDFFRGGYKS